MTARHAPPRGPVLTARRAWWADTVAVVVLATVATAAALAPSPRVHTAADTLPAPTSPPLRTGVVTLDAGPLEMPSIGAVESGSFVSDETTSHAHPGSSHQTVTVRPPTVTTGPGMATPAPTTSSAPPAATTTTPPATTAPATTVPPPTTTAPTTTTETAPTSDPLATLISEATTTEEP